MKNKMILDFHLFEGEGGEGAGEAASTSGSKQDVSQIQYGKSVGEGQTQGQVGSDNSGQAEDLEAEFAAMIGKGGRFHEIYGQKVSGVIQDRFKNQANLQGQVNQITEDLAPLFANYGLKLGDYEGLKTAFTNDDAFYKAGAEKAGLDVSQYKEMLKLRADSERLNALTESYRQAQEKQAKFVEWEGVKRSGLMQSITAVYTRTRAGIKQRQGRLPWEPVRTAYIEWSGCENSVYEHAHG